MAENNKENRHRYFPMFLDSEGCRVLVIGGGNVAQRRIRTLARFEFEITVIAEEVTEEIRNLGEEGRIRYVRGKCAVVAEPLQKPEKSGSAEHLRIDAWPADVILACTDDRELNRQIGTFCRQRNIPVNVCDAREESTFWFPAVALNEELTMGLVGTGEDHTVVSKAAAALRQVIEERSYE